MAKYSDLCLPEKIKLWFGLIITAPAVLALIGALIYNSVELYNTWNFFKGVVSPENVAEYGKMKDVVAANTNFRKEHDHE